jgi:hypothetical protein
MQHEDMVSVIKGADMKKMTDIRLIQFLDNSHGYNEWLDRLIHNETKRNAWHGKKLDALIEFLERNESFLQSEDLPDAVMRIYTRELLALGEKLKKVRVMLGNNNATKNKSVAIESAKQKLDTMGLVFSLLTRGKE